MIDVKKLRQELGLSQDKLAALIGVAPFSIRRYEKGGKQSPLAAKALEEFARSKGY